MDSLDEQLSSIISETPKKSETQQVKAGKTAPAKQITPKSTGPKINRSNDDEEDEKDLDDANMDDVFDDFFEEKSFKAQPATTNASTPVIEQPPSQSADVFSIDQDTLMVPTDATPVPTDSVSTTFDNMSIVFTPEVKEFKRTMHKFNPLFDDEEMIYEPQMQTTLVELLASNHCHKDVEFHHKHEQDSEKQQTVAAFFTSSRYKPSLVKKTQALQHQLAIYAPKQFEDFKKRKFDTFAEYMDEVRNFIHHSQRMYPRTKKRKTMHDASSSEPSSSSDESSDDEDDHMQTKKDKTKNANIPDPEQSMLFNQALTVLQDESTKKLPIPKFKQVLQFLLNSFWSQSFTTPLLQSYLQLQQAELELIQIHCRNVTFASDLCGRPNDSEIARHMACASTMLADGMAGVEILGPIRTGQYSSLGLTILLLILLVDSTFALPTPLIRVGYMDQWISAKPEILSYWEQQALEPYALCKNVKYCAISPLLGFSDKLLDFFKDLTSIYEVCFATNWCLFLQTCKLGSFTPINTLPICWLSLQKTTLTAKKAHKSKTLFIQEYMKQFEFHISNQGTCVATLCNKLVYHMLHQYYSIPAKQRSEESVVLFIISPFHPSHSSSIFLSQLQHLAASFKHLPSQPIVHLLDASTIYSIYQKDALGQFKSIAFDVFEKIRRHVRFAVKPYMPNYTLCMHEPAWTIAVPTNQTMYLYCMYAMVGDALACVWSDSSGHLLDSTIILKAKEDLADVFSKLYDQSIAYMKTSKIRKWHLCICKMDTKMMDATELQGITSKFC